jgi:hypothetical protein
VKIEFVQAGIFRNVLLPFVRLGIKVEKDVLVTLPIVFFDLLDPEGN